MLTAEEIHAECIWEMEGVRIATERYRAAMDTADVTALGPSSKLLRQIVPPLIKAICAAQVEAGEQMSNGGRAATRGLPLILLPADKLALIVAAKSLRVALTSRVAGKDEALGIVAQAGHICSAMRDQIEFDRWEAEQLQAAKDAKRLKDSDHVNLLRRLEKAYPNLSTRAWARWRTKIEVLREQPWEKELATATGAHLIRMLVDTSPDVFEIIERGKGGGQVQYFLALTESASEMLRDLTARAEVARPLLMPMIVRPNPWRYE